MNILLSIFSLKLNTRIQFNTGNLSFTCKKLFERKFFQTKHTQSVFHFKPITNEGPNALAGFKDAPLDGRPANEQTKYANPIESESEPNDLRDGSIVAYTVNTIKKVSTNSTEKICQEFNISCGKLTPNAPWCAGTDTL